VDQVIVPGDGEGVGGRLVPDLRRDEFRSLKTTSSRESPPSGGVVPLSMVVLIDTDLKSKDRQAVGTAFVPLLRTEPHDEAWA